MEQGLTRDIDWQLVAVQLIADAIREAATGKHVARDSGSRKADVRGEAIEFLLSEDCRTWLALTGCDADAAHDRIRRMVETGSYPPELTGQKLAMARANREPISQRALDYRKRAALRILAEEPDLSLREVARRAGIGVNTVRRLGAA